jgi:hypothetical protein
MLANLRALLGVIVDIVLLRRGPDSLPAAPVLLFVFITLYAVSGGLALASLPKPPALLPVHVLINIVVMLLSYHLAFIAAQRRERFVQTVSAVFAVGALFAPAMIPLGSTVMSQAQKPETASGALLILALGLAVWLFVIQIRIVRAALEWPIAGIVGFLIAQELLGALIFVLLFGDPASPPTPA